MAAALWYENIINTDIVLVRQSSQRNQFTLAHNSAHCILHIHLNALRFTIHALRFHIIAKHFGSNYIFCISICTRNYMPSLLPLWLHPPMCIHKLHRYSCIRGLHSSSYMHCTRTHALALMTACSHALHSCTCTHNYTHCTHALALMTSRTARMH